MHGQVQSLPERAAPQPPSHPPPARDGRRRSLAFLLPGLGAGGSEHVVSLLCKAFAGQGWNVTLFAFVEPGTKPFYDPSGQIPLVPLGLPPNTRGNRLLLLARRVKRLRSALARSRPDLLISFLTRTNLIALLADPDCPVIVSERNNAARQKVGALWGYLRRRLYPRAAALVTMTRGAMAQFSPATPAVTRVIPNHASVGRAFAPVPGSGRLVAVGRLVPQKGFDLLLSAFAQVARKHPDWTLTIWGEGPARAALESRRDRLGLHDRVRLPGVTREPGAWTAEADLFVLSSRFEGWGLVVGEAMAAGIPAISFDCDFGPGEMIEQERTGLLVPAGDVDALAVALDRAMSDNALRIRLGHAGRQAMGRFTPDSVVAQWLDLADDLLAGTSAEKDRERHAA